MCKENNKLTTTYKNIMKQLITISTVLFTLLSYSQSPWTKKKNEAFVNVSFTTISNYNEIFGNPDYKTAGTLTDQTYQLYGEYGLTDKTTIVAAIPYKNIVNSNLVNPCLMAPCAEFSNTETNLGNISIGVKQQVYAKDWVIAAQLLTEINSSASSGNGLRTGFDAWTFTPQILAGKGFGQNFVQLQMGLDIRTNNYSENFKIGGEFGRKILKNIWLIAFVDVVKSFENGDVQLPAQNIDRALFVNNQEYGAYGLKGIYEVQKYGITAGFGNAFFGNNVPKQTAVTFGVYRNF